MVALANVQYPGKKYDFCNPFPAPYEMFASTANVYHGLSPLYHSQETRVLESSFWTCWQVGKIRQGNTFSVAATARKQHDRQAAKLDIKGMLPSHFLTSSPG